MAGRVRPFEPPLASSPTLTPLSRPASRSGIRSCSRRRPPRCRTRASKACSRWASPQRLTCGLPTGKISGHAHALVGSGNVAGLLVEKMVDAGLEMLIGITRDPALGVFLTVGRGGSQAEALRDVQFLPAPASVAQVRAAVAELRCGTALESGAAAPLDATRSANWPPQSPPSPPPPPNWPNWISTRSSSTAPEAARTSPMPWPCAAAKSSISPPDPPPGARPAGARRRRVTRAERTTRARCCQGRGPTGRSRSWRPRCRREHAQLVQPGCPFGELIAARDAEGDVVQARPVSFRVPC